MAAGELKAGDSLFCFSGEKVKLDSVFSFNTDTATAVYNLEASGNHNYYVSASKVPVHNKNGGLNLFKFGKTQTSTAEGWQTGDRMFNLPNQGSPKLNWKQNSGFLRSEMKKGKPIFDSYRNADGTLIETKGFLSAERYLLKERGWIYKPSKGSWIPYKK